MSHVVQFDQHTWSLEQQSEFWGVLKWIPVQSESLLCSENSVALDERLAGREADL